MSNRKRSEAAIAVAEFHRVFDLPAAAEPSAEIESTLANLRGDLISEEVDELRDAVRRHDIVGIADALADIVYVAYGTALTYGIDLDAVLREVHRANMSKLGPDGRPVVRCDGKVLKSSCYSPPDVARVLRDSTSPQSEADSVS